MNLIKSQTPLDLNLMDQKELWRLAQRHSQSRRTSRQRGHFWEAGCIPWGQVGTHATWPEIVDRWLLQS